METFETIKNLINEWFDYGEHVSTPDTKFIDLCWEPLDYMEFIINVENLLRVEIDDKSICDMDKWSLGQFCEYIDSLPKVRDEILYTPEQYFSMNYGINEKN